MSTNNQLRFLEEWQPPAGLAVVHLHASSFEIGAFTERHDGVNLSNAVAAVLDPPVQPGQAITANRNVFPGCVRWDSTGKVTAFQVNSPYRRTGLSDQLILSALRLVPHLYGVDDETTPLGKVVAQRINALMGGGFDIMDANRLGSN